MFSMQEGVWFYWKLNYEQNEDQIFKDVSRIQVFGEEKTATWPAGNGEAEGHTQCHLQQGKSRVKGETTRNCQSEWDHSVDLNIKYSTVPGLSLD